MVKGQDHCELKCKKIS